MIFSPALAQAVLEGRKTVTRRLTKGKPCFYRVGQDYAVMPGRGKKQLGRIRISGIVEYGSFDTSFEWWSDEEANWEGFENIEELEAYWDELHGPGYRDEPVYRIEFELVDK